MTPYVKRGISRRPAASARARSVGVGECAGLRGIWDGNSTWRAAEEAEGL